MALGVDVLWAILKVGISSWFKRRAQQGLLISQEVGRLASWTPCRSHKGNTLGSPLKLPRREHLPSSKEIGSWQCWLQNQGHLGARPPQMLIDWSRGVPDSGIVKGSLVVLCVTSVEIPSSGAAPKFESALKSN